MGKGGSGNESMFSFRKVEYLEEVYVDTSKCKLLVPQGSINAYKAAEVWKDFFNIETDLNGISSDAEASAEWFDLRGRSINAPRKGLNIIRQGGKTQKVIVR